MNIDSQAVLQILRKNYCYSGSSVNTLKDSFNLTFNVDDTLFVKVSKIGQLQAEEEYAARVALVRMMGQEGIPVSELIKTEQNQDYVKIGEEYLFEVHRWISNMEAYSSRTNQLEQVATAMAQYHKYLDSLDNSEIRTIKELHSAFRGITEKGEKPFLEELAEYETRLNEVSPRLKSHLLRTIPLLKDAYLTTPDKSDIDLGIIHADLHDLQMMFDTKTGDLKSLIDWESACYDTRVIDMGYTIERLSMDSKRLYVDLDSQLQNFPHNFKKMDIFFEKYDKVRTLTPVHLQEIANQLVLRYLNSNARLLRKVFYSDSSVNYDKILFGLRILSPERLDDFREYFDCKI